MAEIDTAQMRPLAEAGYDLIPLHRRAKRPLHTNWTKRIYNSSGVIEDAEIDGNNVGVRLRASDLVIDYDPRHDPRSGTEPTSLAELVLMIGLDPTDYPAVKTGGGGLHLYLLKPDDLSVRDRLAGFPGIEFKTLGRQVVAPGSVHPDTGAQYVWFSGSNDDDPCFSGPDHLSYLGAPMAPEALLDLIRRPQQATSGGGGGEYTPEELAEMLDALDPEDFRDHERWRDLMMACHHATAGDGRTEFIAWSIGDPQYASHASNIGQRWDSLHADAEGPRVTARTLIKVLCDAGRGDVIPRTPPEDDFQDDSPEVPIEDKPDEAGRSGNPADALVLEMNGTHCAVLHGGKFQIFMLEHDDAFRRDVWVPYSREAFGHFYEDERVPLPDTPKSRFPSKADVWLRSPNRRKYHGIVLDPQGLPENERKLNLWRGWAVEPRPGDWSLMRELIDQVLCEGDTVRSDYVHRWIAHMFQRPWLSPEAAIVFRGKEGTGKGTLARALMRIAGAHGLTVSSSQQFAGRFNAHLRDVVFLFADEAVAPTDKEGNSVLKQLVTEPIISYEGKGRDIVPGRNMVHIIMASNERWVVPAGPEARRYLVSEVSDARRNDRAFFARLWAQMESGGYEAMLHDMLGLDLNGWSSANPPSTTALGEQKVMSLDPLTEFWRERLMRGDLADLVMQADDEFEWSEDCDTPLRLEPKHKDEIINAVRAFVDRRRALSTPVNHKALVNAGKCFGLEAAHSGGGRSRLWIVPPLRRARELFEQHFGVPGHFDGGD
jgi:hypothetical protein